jgi:hypothetical protein
MAKFRPRKKKQPTKHDLEQMALLQQLVELAENLGFQVRMEEGQFQGGICRVREDRQMIVNKKIQPEHKVRLVAAELSRENLDDIFIVPALREIIEANRVSEETTS